MTSQGLLQLNVASTIASLTNVQANEKRRILVRSVAVVVRK